MERRGLIARGASCASMAKMKVIEIAGGGLAGRGDAGGGDKGGTGGTRGGGKLGGSVG